MTETAPWPWAIVDEAYQMRSDLLLRMAGRFEKALFVGDPGQLDPFSTVETERWLGLSRDPMSSAVAVLLNHNPRIPVHTLPVSWRLPATAAPVVSESFYPFTGFASAISYSQRQLGWHTRAFGKSALDVALETAAESGSALYELRHRHTPRTDAEAVRACAGLAARLLQRGAHTLSERAVASVPVTPSRVAVGTEHRDQALAVKRALAEAGIRDVIAGTANRLQGREFDVVIVLHPLSGRRGATAFHLEAGRLCVLTSRHRHACSVVARAGIPELPGARPSAGAWQRDQAGISEGVVRNRRGWAGGFVAALADGDAVRWEDAGVAMVNAYIVERGKGYAPASCSLLVSAMRPLLRWALATGRIDRDLNRGILRPRATRATLPRGLTPGQAGALLAAASPATRAGVRDRAVVITLSRLGLALVRPPVSRSMTSTGQPAG